MKKIFAAAAVVTALATPAMSADMAVKARPMAVAAPAYDWSGFYFGAAVGGAWVDYDHSFYLAPASNVGASKTLLNYAGFGGVQKQFGAWVFGVEGAWNNNLNDINTAIIPGFVPAGAVASARIRDLTTFGGRVGYAGWSNWLLYAQGGWAGASYAFDYQVGGAAFAGAAALNGGGRTSGWYAGVGLEYMVYKGVIADTVIGAEYQHIDLNSVRSVYNAPLTINGVDSNADIDLVRARISFKFNPWRPAAVVAKY